MARDVSVCRSLVIVSMDLVDTILARSLVFEYFTRLSASVATVDSEVSASHVQTCIAEQECDWSHQVFRPTHLTHRNE